MSSTEGSGRGADKSPRQQVGIPVPQNPSLGVSTPDPLILGLPPIMTICLSVLAGGPPACGVALEAAGGTLGLHQSPPVGESWGAACPGQGLFRETFGPSGGWKAGGR